MPSSDVFTNIKAFKYDLRKGTFSWKRENRTVKNSCIKKSLESWELVNHTSTLSDAQDQHTSWAFYGYIPEAALLVILLLWPLIIDDHLNTVRKWKWSKKRCNPHKMFIVHTNKIVDVFTVQNHFMSKHIKTAKDEDKHSSWSSTLEPSVHFCQINCDHVVLLLLTAV